MAKPSQHVAPAHKGASRKTTLIRALVSALAIVLWLGVMGVGGPTFGKMSEVQSTDQTTFLPASAEATKAVQWQNRFDDSESIPAIIIAESDSALSPQAGASLKEALGGVAALSGEVIGPIPSKDGKALQFIARVGASADVKDTVDDLRQRAQGVVESGDLGQDARVHVSGPAGFTADLKGAFAGIDGLLLLVALCAVLIILLIVYRSALLPLAVLLTAMAALCAAITAVYFMAKADIIRIDGQSQGILSILVIGAATDYCLLFVARFREAVARGEVRSAAVTFAWRRSLEPILASAGTVIAGLLCLTFSDLNSNKALGPIAASGIAFSVLATFTLLPAFLWLLGRTAFWPVNPEKSRSRKTHPALEGHPELAEHPTWGRVALFVRAHHRVIWIATAAVLALGCIGVTGLKASGVPESQLVLGNPDSRAGTEAIARHFDGGSGLPALVFATSAAANQTLDAVQDAPGVASATFLGQDGGPVRPGNDRKEVQGRVQINATLSATADSEEALSAVAELRERVHAVDPEALVGGPSATALDKQTTAEQDVKKIIPIVLIAITLILILLLRSLVAPLILVATTILSYGTAMGVSAWVFNGVFNFPGADPAVPLFGFTFLVALGVDYNIFLASRVREETRLHGAQEGLTRGLAFTGGVITSAGVVLAATFAALSVIPIMFMVQLGFIVAFGVLLDTLVVRTLLVPALGHDLGRALWWPSKLARGQR